MRRDATDVRPRPAAAMAHAGPRLAGADLDVLPPAAALPRSTPVAEEIIGHAAVLPDDLTAVVTALARIHQLPLPEPADRAQLPAAADPMTDMPAEIEAQAAHLDAEKIDSAARRCIDAEVDRYRSLCSLPSRPPLSLISLDAYPGNFTVRDDDRAMLVNLEKCRYSHASLALAHATLYTTTTRDVASKWLWSLTWCAKWRVASTAARAVAAEGEDWSTELSEPTLICHVRGRVDHHLGLAIVDQVPSEFDTLEKAMRPPVHPSTVMIVPHRP